ncbi:Protein of unknown function [Cohaesibacter marisflavi]|uniref:DUF2628 domain-containing protein n=1 Tax=Cohaesibacter marisflavi TaxID=655353 RepID=A0A1I5GN84_9HYPH|nr:DUF2628 domain-containing protein [Cohaesibacter marisflavi]SFO37379.1 Protein of unknown function [Cohaesibacter marisflavi]
MASYTIYEKPGFSLDQTVESAVILKNHYSALAFFLPVLWMLFKRLWWVLLGYCLFMIPLWSLYDTLPLWSEMLISLIISVWISVEAPNLIGWQLERKGYQEVVTLYAEDQEHCEQRYIAFRLEAADRADKKETPTYTQASRSVNDKGLKRFATAEPTGKISNGPVLGLFPTPNSSQETK